MKIFILLLAVALAQSPTYPDAKLTPGVIDPNITQANIQKTICVHGSTKDSRHVTAATKRKVFEEYGIDYNKHSGDYEVDHLESLELGGANDIKNLWPQRYEPRPGAREKDVVETHLKRSICKGVISLAEGQDIIRTDWYRCYLQIKSKRECSVK